MLKLNVKKWNDGDKTRMPKLERVCATHRATIRGTPAGVADALATPSQPPWFVGWAPDASCLLAEGSDGRALWTEETTGRTLFRTPKLPTFWYPTLFEGEQGRCHVAILQPGLAIGHLEIAFTADGDNTAVTFELTYTSEAESNNALLDDGFGGRMETMLACLATSLADCVTSAGDGERHHSAPVVATAACARISNDIVVEGVREEHFALACPVAELDWIEDWHFDLLHSDSGTNEVGCMFHEPFSGPVVLRHIESPTRWYTTVFDADAWRFTALLSTDDLVTGLFEFSAEKLDDGKARMTWRLTYVGTSEQGSELVREAGFEDRMRKMLRFLAVSIKTYIETGSVYRLAHRYKAHTAISLIGAMLGRHFRRVAGTLTPST